MISIVQWRAAIGSFSPRRKTKRNGPKQTLNVNFGSSGICLKLILALSILVIVSGDIESNPGPDINDVLAEIKDMRLSMDNQFKTLKGDIEAITLRVEDLSNDMSILRERVTIVENRIDTMLLDVEHIDEHQTKLRDYVDLVEDEIDKLEQYSRKENVLLHGIPVSDSETYDSMRRKVSNILNKNLHTNKWKETDIVRAHRLGKGKEGRPPPVIVRFHQFIDKLSVLKSRDKLKEGGIGISNDLTRRQRSKLDSLSKQNKRGYYKGGKLIVEEMNSAPASAPVSDGSHSRIFTATRRHQSTQGSSDTYATA